MMKYIAKRLLHFVLVVLGITCLTFLLIHSVSGDAVDILYDNASGASEEVKEAVRDQLGLNAPLFSQYLRWLVHMVQGDFGASYISGNSVLYTFMSKLPNTIYLTLTSILLTACFSIPLGVIAATKHNTWLDYLIRSLSFVGNALPGFFVSLLMILIFSVKLKWFLVVGGEGLKSIILPTLTLSFAMSAKYTRQVRTVVLEELGKEYVTGARARGVKETVILYGSVLKCCMPAMIALFALSIGSLLGGTAIIESIFMWDGVGKLALDAIIMRDIPMIQAYVIWMSIIYAIINLIADIGYRILDPRMKKSKEEVL